MKCQKKLRECPNGWTDCNLCANKKSCDDGTYEPDDDRESVIIAAEIVEKQIHAEVVESVEKIKAISHEAFMQMSGDEIFARLAKYRPPNLHHKEPIPLDGPSAPGGGSKSKNHKKPNRKLPEYMKFLGM